MGLVWTQTLIIVDFILNDFINTSFVTYSVGCGQEGSGKILHGKLSLWGILLRCVCNENNVFHMELSGWFALRECVLFLFCPVNIQRFVFIKIEFIHYKQLITNNNILTYFQNPP